MSAPTTFDLDRLRLPDSYPPRKRERVGRPPRHRPGERFLRGPIPWDWLTKAARQPGRALHVALELWRWAGIKRTREISLSLSGAARELGTSRSALSRGLRALEGAGLVSVERKAGRKPTVTLLDVRCDHDTAEPSTDITASAELSTRTWREYPKRRPSWRSEFPKGPYEPNAHPPIPCRR